MVLQELQVLLERSLDVRHEETLGRLAAVEDLVALKHVTSWVSAGTEPGLHFRA